MEAIQWHHITGNYYYGNTYRYYTTNNQIVTNNQYYEPETAYYYDNTQGNASYYLGISSYQLQEQMQKEFEDMVRSVNQYRRVLCRKIYSRNK